MLQNVVLYIVYNASLLHHKYMKSITIVRITIMLLILILSASGSLFAGDPIEHHETLLTCLKYLNIG